MNAEKLAKLQAQVRLGGKGTARRKKKVVHKTAATDDKKLQSSLKKISVNQIPGIEEVNMIKDDGTVMHFNNPKVQASLASNTFAIAGHAENKQITELLPGILNQLGAESLSHLRKLAGGVGGLGAPDSTDANDADDEDEDEEVPELVENFDEVCQDELPSTVSSHRIELTSEIDSSEEEIESIVEEVSSSSEENEPLTNVINSTTKENEPKIMEIDDSIQENNELEEMKSPDELCKENAPIIFPSCESTFQTEAALTNADKTEHP